ncbi:MAG: hypothetical protein ACFFFG_11700 [Candidatus Thorarchaeota archaeon]
MVGITTLRFTVSGKYVQAMVIFACSGISGLLLFADTYLIVMQLTTCKSILRGTQLVVFAVLGALGAYLVNRVRILILLVFLLHFHQFLDFIHLSLGTLLFIVYFVGYWTTIWTHLSKVGQIKKNIQKIA